jgi:NAD(P)-dependent dehydrogenase (short-subunit alcohol dehydrogenase family)
MEIQAGDISLGLQGRRALVVGAGGIGEVCARELLRQGAKLAIADINQDRLDSLPFKEETFALQCDITDPAECRHLVEKAYHKLGGLDILIHLAGASRSVNLAMPSGRTLLTSICPAHLPLGKQPVHGWGNKAMAESFSFHPSPEIWPTSIMDHTQQARGESIS